MAMRSSRKPQFTVMTPPSLKYKFSMRGLGICMTGAILLRKMNPRGGAAVPQTEATVVGGNACESGASEGENAPTGLGGVTEERKNEDA